MPFEHFKAHRNAEFEANWQLSGGHMSGQGLDSKRGMRSQTCITYYDFCVIDSYCMHKHFPHNSMYPHTSVPMTGQEG